MVEQTDTSELDATTVDMQMPDIPEGDSASPTACMIQIHPVVGRCGVQYLGNETTIGRDKDSNFHIHMESVSRNHATITRQADGRYRVADLGSTNGTFVNDVRVREWDLEPGDIVRCGGAILKVLPADDLEARYHEVAYTMMTHDSLTGIHNRQYFEEALERELARCHRYKETLGVLMMDIDHFKAVNDLHGHLAGDDILREFGRRAKTVLRGECIVARIGGEEFGVIVQQAEPDAVSLVAERLREATSSRKFRVTDAQIGITISVGIARTDGSTPKTVSELLGEADANLYEAKKRGRNRVHPGVCPPIPADTQSMLSTPASDTDRG